MRSRTLTDTSPAIWDIVIEHRPKGFISYTGHTKYDGWTLMQLQRRDGVLLNVEDQPLKDGEPPVYLPREVYEDADFSAVDFGEFVDEKEVGGVTRTTRDAVFANLGSSGSIGMKPHFMAQHRTRPITKIVLSNRPNGEGTDGFGTRIVYLNLSTPHLEFVLIEYLTRLMCEFLEGKASIKTIETENFAFVQLSDSLVDCEPNEQGMDSWFDMMHAYTPITFLEDLAKRLRSVYLLEVEIIEGKEGGLVLRHDHV